MKRLDDTLQDFGDDLGMPGLRLGARGHLSLRVGEGKRIDVHARENCLLALRFVELPAGRRLSLKRRALALCREFRATGWDISAGLSAQGDLLLIGRIAEQQASRAALVHLFSQLERLDSRLSD